MSHRVRIHSSITLATKQVTGQLERRHFCGSCLSPEAVCLYAYVCAAPTAVFSIILRHIVWYSQHHSIFYPPYSLAPHPTHTTAVEKWMRRVLFVYSYSPDFTSLHGSDTTRRWPAEAVNGTIHLSMYIIPQKQIAIHAHDKGKMVSIESVEFGPVAFRNFTWVWNV